MSQEDKRAQNRERKRLAGEAFQGKLDNLALKTQGGEFAGAVKEVLTAWDDLKARFPALRDIGTKVDDNTANDSVTTGTAANASSTASAASAVKPAEKSSSQAAPAVVESKEEEKKVEYVTRYEIREMSAAQQDRFFDAIDKMMENKDGKAGTSDFFRCASYHGNPPPIYCKHGRETFPGWHRIYLLDFEKSLRAADRALGNDGNIGLPYWDWSVRPEDGLPAVIRKRFGSWPKDLFPADIGDKPSLSRNDDATIASMIESWGVIETARDCLLSPQHFAHASTGGEWASSYPSVEAPHNYMHVIVGGQGGVMGAVAWAAFDIAFWMHHCNVDRIYETYCQMEPDSKDEFEWTQKQQGSNLYEEAFEPFKKDDGKPYYPSDTFDVKKLGFVYNTPFPAPQGQQLRMAPTVAMFPNVKVNEFESKCYQIHVFVINKKEEAKWNEPKKISEIDFTSDNYAGGSGVFGRGMECDNCQSRLPYDIVVDITKKLTKLRLSRYDAKLKVYCMETTDTSGNLIKCEDTPLPNPVITGPLFEDQQGSLTKDTKDAQNSEEVRALQRYLKRFGYYDDELDGSYGPITEKAVKIYQQATGTLKQDGKAGPNTKRAIRELRRCSNKDGFGENKVEDEMAHPQIKDKEVKMYNGKTKITYNLGVCPGYMYRAAVQDCLGKAFKLWSDATKGEISFEELPSLGDEAKADIYFSWSTASMRDGDLMKFDGVGGVLGHGGLKDDGTKGFVVFDTAERWVVGYPNKWNRHEMAPSNLNDPQTWYRGQPTISLFYTTVHEVGHALGLDHSINAKDFMSPFYDPKRNSLSNNDVARVKQSFGLA